MSGMETQEQVKHHAEEARKWAEAADREATGSGRDHGLAGEVSMGKHTWKRAGIYSAVSQAHSLAALATVLGEGYISGEMEMVKFAGSEPSSQRTVPVVPAPGVPARHVLTVGQRVLAIPTEGHVWPPILRAGAAVPREGVAGVVEGIHANKDLINVVVDGPAWGQVGPTVQFHREQLRIPAPPPPEPPGEPEASG